MHGCDQCGFSWAQECAFPSFIDGPRVSTAPSGGSLSRLSRIFPTRAAAVTVWVDCGAGQAICCMVSPCSHVFSCGKTVEPSSAGPDVCPAAVLSSDPHVMGCPPSVCALERSSQLYAGARHSSTSCSVAGHRCALVRFLHHADVRCTKTLACKHMLDAP